MTVLFPVAVVVAGYDLWEVAVLAALAVLVDRCGTRRTSGGCCGTKRSISTRIRRLGCAKSVRP